ncbi:MAG: ACP S-malonyltransferase [Gammaproteobacteria bacterium]
MLTYLFPGQGSQSKGMGNGLFSEFPDLIQEADKILGFSIQSLCLDDPDQALNQTQYTQPAIYVVSALSYFKKIRDTQSKPDYVCGHSLGEYNALLAAEVFDFSTGLTLVKKRSELMSQAKEGGMAAILGLSIDDVKQILTQNSHLNLSIANYNSYTQIVISGPKHDIEQAQTIFTKDKSVNFIQLKVSGAFHSPCMQQAKEDFALYLNEFQFAIPTIPVIANLDAQFYHPAVIKENLADQITHAVQWTPIIEYLQAHENMRYEEIGPGKVLTGLLQRIQKHQ